MSEASLTRILANRTSMSLVLPASADLTDWLQTITLDAIDKNRTNIIVFPLKRRPTNDDDTTTAPAA